MSDAETSEYYDPFGVEDFLASFTEISPGHADEAGNVQPEFRDQEVKNTIASMSSRMYVLDRRENAPNEVIADLAKRGLRIIIQKYPQELEIISQGARDIKSLTQFVDLIPQDTKEIIEDINTDDLKYLTDFEVVNLVKAVDDRKAVNTAKSRIDYIGGFRLGLAQSLVFGAGKDDPPNRVFEHVVGTAFGSIQGKLDLEGIKLDDATELMRQSVNFARINIPEVGDETVLNYLQSDPVQRLITSTGFNWKPPEEA